MNGRFFTDIVDGAIIGNEADAAKNILESVKTDIWLSEEIGKYWPKLRAYIEKGDGQSQKYRHLLNSDAVAPLIKWGAELVRASSTPKSEGDEWSGAILNAAVSQAEYAVCSSKWMMARYFALTLFSSTMLRHENPQISYANQ